MICCIWFYFWF